MAVFHLEPSPRICPRKQEFFPYHWVSNRGFREGYGERAPRIRVLAERAGKGLYGIRYGQPRLPRCRLDVKNKGERKDCAAGISFLTS